jgi:Ni2+-binding GTPase involved in maturation of urease and hydrogenase
MKAYSELVSRILNAEDQEKYEWAIGAMLTGSVPRAVQIVGPAGSGKTTLTSIIRSLLTRFEGDFSPRVAFLSWDRLIPQLTEDTYVFIELLDTDMVQNDSLAICTHGGDIPVNKYHVLMNLVEDELSDIANFCINLYRHLGIYHYDNLQENN